MRLSHERGTTPFATLLGAFQVLLSRYTGQQDFAVAVPMAGRTRSETEDLIGFFVNTVVVRADLAGNPLFADVLDRTQHSLLEGLTHQEAPFERIVEELHPDRDLGRNPLAQVLFGARDPLPAFDATGLSVERYEWGQGSAGFDLAVEVEVSPDGIRGRVDFPRDLFEEGTVRLLLRHYQALLVAVAVDPQARVKELPLGNDEALRQVIADGTGESRPVPNRLLHELLSERAASWPDATALQWEGGQLTYAQLETWAGEIAAGLRADGAGPGTVVAVLLPRGPELVAAILGVLQSGAAYLPLDPAQPRGRLELMLADAKARFALTDQRLAPRLDDLPVQVLLIDRPAGGAVSPGNQATAGSPEQLAYVIFTSGSTGRPKPVAVSHRALVNHALAMLDLFELRASDRVLQFASPGFDVFGEELFPTLLAGARLVLPPATALPVQSVAEFETALQASAVSVVNLPCSFWAQWTKDVLSAHRQPPASLRLVVIGSEQADGRLLERWRRHSSVPVANVYGVSEATVSTTALMPAQATPLCRVPVGRPISNTQAIVLDAALRPVPSGVVGELFLGGLGVAQGYLDRPELTAERFLPNPYGPPGSRLYRTGDLARWLPSGSLDLIGRVDEQVKIRGHRIELGEIESLLAEHPCILQAAVSVRDGRATGSPAWSRTWSAPTLRPPCPSCASSCASGCRRACCPRSSWSWSGFRCPLTASWTGVPCRRRRLGGWRAGGPLGRRRRRPKGRCWRSGGSCWDTARSELTTTSSSWEGTRCWRPRWCRGCASGCRTSCPCARSSSAPVSPRWLKPSTPARPPRANRRRRPCCGAQPAPPIGSLPASSTRSSTRPRSEAPHMSHEDELTALPLSFAQERLWFLDQLIPGSPAYTIFDAVRLRGPLDLEALRRSIAELVRRHEVLRSTFPSVSGRPVQVVQPPAPLEVPLIDLRSVPPERRQAELDRALADEAARPLSLTSAPAAPRLPLSAGGRGARADSRRPPHRLRRLVGRGASLRARRALRRLPPRRALAAARARTAVRRLRRLAARVADRGRASARARSLARGARERSPPAPPPLGPAPSVGRAVQGPPARVRARRRTRGRRPPTRPQPGRHRLHDAAGRLPGPPSPLLGAGRRCWSARRSPTAVASSSSR